MHIKKKYRTFRRLVNKNPGFNESRYYSKTKIGLVSNRLFFFDVSREEYGKFDWFFVYRFFFIFFLRRYQEKNQFH